MKYVTVRDLQINLTTLLRDLPFTVTRYGRPVAVVSAVGPQTKVKEVKSKIKKVAEEKEIKMCKHAAAIGNCKYGCK